MYSFFKIIFSNIIGFDGLIFIFAFINAGVYFMARGKVNRIYNHFNTQDQVKNLPDDSKNMVKMTTKMNKKMLTANDLLKSRESMNKYYAIYTNLTTMFPLMGMLGTVISLIPMVDEIGTAATGSFFVALTSTFWGIIAALIFKFLDASISYKIDDNEKHMEYLFNPKRKEQIQGE